MSATLRLVRNGTGIELRRGTFEVSVDGKRVGSIDWLGDLEIQVQPGRHEIRIAKGRYSSRAHDFEVAEGSTAAFQVHGAMLWPRYVASIFKPDLAISLKHE
jgi:hypothetical protein